MRTGGEAGRGPGGGATGRGPRLALGVATVIGALALAGAAAAHPALTPATLESGVSTRIVAEIPNERLGHATTHLTLSFPRGFTVVAAEAAGAWRPSLDGGTVSWSGGRISGENVVDLPLTLRARVPAGTYDVELEQRYEDGEQVPTKTQVSVFPALGENAPAQHYGRAIAAGVVGFVIVVGSLLTIRALRRGSPS